MAQYLEVHAPLLLVHALFFVLGGFLAVPVGAVVVGRALKPFLQALHAHHPPSGETPPDRSVAGLPNAGRTIGMLERALIFLFVLMDQAAGIGFLVAAKSVFRFGEVKHHRNRMEAEYILIGTLMSFAYGILVAYLMRLMISLTLSPY